MVLLSALHLGSTPTVACVIALPEDTLCMVQMDMVGKESSFMKPGLKPACKEELAWAWDALSSSTCCKSLSVMVSGACVFQAGLIPEGGKPGKAVDGAISRRTMSSGKADFLANLALYPGAAPPVLPVISSFSPSETRKIVLNVRNFSICTGTTGRHHRIVSRLSFLVQHVERPRCEAAGLLCAVQMTVAG